MELTRTDAVFSRITMVLFMCRSKRSRNYLKLHGATFQKIRKIPAKDEGQGAHRLSTRVGGGPAPLGRAPYLVGPLELLRLQLQLYISCFREKKIREKKSSRFTIRSRRQALKPLGRADLESARGSGEGNPSPSSSSTILHHQFHDAHRSALVIPS